MVNIFGKSKQVITLKDYNKIWTRFCFLDESGSLVDVKDPFFTIGFIKCSQPYYINSKILYERQKNNFYDEIKFNKLSRRSLDFAKRIIDIYFSTESLYFNSYTLYKDGKYFNNTFGGDPWRAYEDISIRVLKSATTTDDEILIVIADHVTAPRYVKFEVNVKYKINTELQRLAIAGVCRIDSKANDLLQLTDLIVGAINYDLKLSTGIIQRGDKYKRRFLEHLKSKLGVSHFLDGNGFKGQGFDIFIDKDAKERLPLVFPEKEEEKEKEQSS